MEKVFLFGWGSDVTLQGSWIAGILIYYVDCFHKFSSELCFSQEPPRHPEGGRSGVYSYFLQAPKQRRQAISD